MTQLRVLVAFLIGVAVVCSTALADEPADAKAWAKSVNGRYQTPQESKGYSLHASKTTDDDFRRLMDLNPQQLGSLDLGGPLVQSQKLTPDGFKHLRRLPNLWHLRMFRTATDAEVGAAVEKCPNLEWFEPSAKGVTDGALRHVVNLKRLRHIDFGWSQVTDGCWAELAKVPTLERVGMMSTKVTGAGIGRLAVLKNFEGLDLVDTQVGDAALKEIGTIKQLQELSLWERPVTDAGIAHLRGCGELRTLKLYGTKVTDAAMTTLSGLSKLERLDIRSTAVTDAGLAKLHNNKHLRSLDVHVKHVTRPGIDALQKALPECQVLVQ